MEAQEKINHPKHYNNHPSGAEAVDIIRSFCFNIGNCFKYIFRRNDKNNTIDDLRKSIFYIDDELKRRRKYKYFIGLPNLLKYKEFINRSKLVNKVLEKEEDETIGLIYDYLNKADYNYRGIYYLLLAKILILSTIEKRENE